MLPLAWTGRFAGESTGLGARKPGMQWSWTLSQHQDSGKVMSFLIKWGVVVELNIQFLRLADFLVSPDLSGSSKDTNSIPVIWKDLGAEDDSLGEWSVFEKHGLTSKRRVQLAPAGLQTERRYWNYYNWTDQRWATLELCSRRRVLRWLTLVWERKTAQRGFC